MIQTSHQVKRDTLIAHLFIGIFITNIQKKRQLVYIQFHLHVHVYTVNKCIAHLQHHMI